MRNLSTRLAAKQSGFTLMELVIVIVIIGILAAVALPKLTSVSDAAHKATNMAVLGMVKSAWSAGYAVAKTVPTGVQIAAQTSEPVCTGTATSISCPVAWISSTGAAGTLSITYDASATSPVASLVCTTAADCN